jgi:hypothetical protein
VRIEKGASAAMITRTDRQRSVKVMASLDGVSLDAAVARAQKIAAEILPLDLSLKLTGDAEAMKEAGSQFVMMLVLARARDLHGARRAVRELRAAADRDDRAAVLDGRRARRPVARRHVAEPVQHDRDRALDRPRSRRTRSC